MKKDQGLSLYSQHQNALLNSNPIAIKMVKDSAVAIRKDLRKLDAKMHWKKKDNAMSRLFHEYTSIGRAYILSCFGLKKAKKFMKKGLSYYSKIRKPKKYDIGYSGFIADNLSEINSYLKDPKFHY